MTVADHSNRPGHGPGPVIGGRATALSLPARQLQADTYEPLTTRRQPTPSGGPGVTIPGAHAGTGHDTAPRNGLPAAVSGPGRAVRVALGLYQPGRSDPALRPPVPPGEPDAFDAPPLPWMPVRRPRGGRR